MLWKNINKAFIPFIVVCVVKLVGFFIGEKVAEVLFQKMVDLSMNIFAPVLICHITSVPIFLSRFIGKKGFF